MSTNYIDDQVGSFLAALPLTEITGDDNPLTGPCKLSLTGPENSNAGYVRLWSAQSGDVDRMAHVRLLAGPVTTDLLFVFGKDDSPLPHYHAQLVQFPPDGCVYNVDFMPRLDAIEHPVYLTEVFSGLTKPYLKATTNTENSCAKALMNPAIAAYLSPWGIVSQRADKEELERLRPLLEMYLNHYLVLCDSLRYSAADADELKSRNTAHLERFFDDDLDPRAWRGVYKIVGEDTGLAIKAILKTSIHQ